MNTSESKKISPAKVSGFTLVELIVVIAIIGVLAAILIPTMMGRVKQSKLATANDAAAKIAEQAAVIIADMEKDGSATGLSGNFYVASEGGNVSLGSIKVPTKKDLNGSDKTDEEEAFKVALENNVPALKTGHWGIWFNDTGAVQAVAFTSDGKYLGTYPNAMTEPFQTNGTISDNCMLLAMGVVKSSN